MNTPKLENKCFLFLEESPGDSGPAMAEIQNYLPDSYSHSAELESGFLTAFKACDPDLVICGFPQPDFGGHQVLSILREISPLTPVIILTTPSKEDLAIECMLSGAVNYVL